MTEAEQQAAAEKAVADQAAADAAAAEAARIEKEKADGAPAKTEAELQAEREAAAAAKKDGEVNRRFSEQTKARERAERDRDEANRRLTLALEAMERAGGGDAEAAKKKAAAEDPEPVAPTFTDPEQYTKDMGQYAKTLSEWNTRRAVAVQMAEAERKRTEDGQRQGNEAMRSEFAKRRAKAIEARPDFVEIAEAVDLPISEHMAAAIVADEMGTDVQLWLGEHREEAERISKLPAGRQFVEFGVLKERLLAARKEATVTRVPAPIKVVGAATTTVKPLADLPMEDYAARRTEALRAEKRGGRAL